MPVAGNDSYGSFLDTGIGSLDTNRPVVENETHVAADVTADTGAKFASVAALNASHINHRDPNCPR